MPQQRDEESFARAKTQFKPDVLKKLNNMFIDYLMSSDSSDDEKFSSLMSSIERYELDVNNKFIAQLSSTEKDSLLLQQFIQQLNTTLSVQEEQLSQLEKLLSSEKVQLIERREYDALSEAILRYEDRQVQYNSVSDLKNALESKQSENRQLVQLIELRHKQFAFLMNTLDELTTTFNYTQEDSIQSDRNDDEVEPQQQQQQQQDEMEEEVEEQQQQHEQVTNSDSLNMMID